VISAAQARTVQTVQLCTLEVSSTIHINYTHSEKSTFRCVSRQSFCHCHVDEEQFFYKFPSSWGWSEILFSQRQNIICMWSVYLLAEVTYFN